MTAKRVGELLSRLRRVPEAAALMRTLRAVQEALFGAQAVYQAAVDERVCCTAEMEASRREMNRRTLLFSKALLFSVEGRRDDLRYRRIFPTTASEAVQTGVEADRRGLVARARAAMEGDPSLLPAAATLASLEAETARWADLGAEQRRLQGIVVQRRLALEAAAAAARLAFSQTHGGLRLLFVDRPERVRALFPPRRRRAAGAPEEVEEAQAAARAGVIGGWTGADRRRGRQIQDSYEGPQRAWNAH